MGSEGGQEYADRDANHQTEADESPRGMPLDKQTLDRLRRSNLVLPGRRAVRSDRDAARWIDARGFAPLAPVDGCSLPSMSDADANGGSWEVTDGSWRWKDTLPGARACVYTKFFRSGGTFIAWDQLPCFYVLYATGRSTGEDYRDGLLSRMEKHILEVVEENGPLDSRELWKRIRADFGGPRSRFLGALAQLQKTFRLTVCGGSLEGWSIHHWDVMTRQAPAGLLDDLPLPDEAREKLLLKYVANAVACPVDEPGRLLRWGLSRGRQVVDDLVSRRRLVVVTAKDWPGPVLTLPA